MWPHIVYTHTLPVTSFRHDLILTRTCDKPAEEEAGDETIARIRFDVLIVGAGIALTVSLRAVEAVEEAL